jgi:serine/threonine protein phosphatase 1
MSRQIIIGDIHGCYNDLLRLLDKISPSESDTVVALGDIIDRGPDSVRVLNLFRSRQNFESIIGNHERKHITGYYSYAQEITKIQFGTEYPEAINWLKKLPYYREYESAIVIHAAIEPGIPLENQREEVLCGSSSGEKYLKNIFNGTPWYEFYEGSKPIIFGHNVFDGSALVYGDKVYGIDTGACHGGYLTAITLPDFKMYSVKSGGDYWKKLKQEFQANVLYARPWKQMSWDQIDKEIGKIQYLINEKQCVDLIQFVEWKVKIDQLMTKILIFVRNETRRILDEVGNDDFPIIAKNHAFNQLLFQSKSGKLTIESLKKKCPNPDALLNLAHKMSINATGLESVRFGVDR